MVEKLDMDFKAIHNTRGCWVTRRLIRTIDNLVFLPPPPTPSHLASPRPGSTKGYATLMFSFPNSRLIAANSVQRMTLDGGHIFDERDDQSDDESLFGSPPPSPGTGRSLSLALPSGGLDSEQNVGTLALPGSHNPSKLPVDSAVSDACHHPFESLSSCASIPARTVTSRPTSLASTATDSNTGSRPLRSSANGTQKKRKRTKTTSNATSTPTPGPSIELPPSDVPVPPNFLRNQQALLGIAGLVANINPASLSARRHNQGNDPNNPIMVEDEGTTLPRLGHSAAPTPAQLLATLSAQKELFPVLEQLLNILRRGVDPPTQPPLNPSQQPPKRRKLSRVPAGAAEWDVPFPFLPGEGPPNYQEEWTNERCERLISDFVTLLRDGANKAAARASAKRATSQPAPQSSVQSNPTSARWSVPPTNGNQRSPSSSYVPLPLDAYLRPTLPHTYTTFPPTPTMAESPDPGVDLLTSIFGAVMPPQDNHLPNVNTPNPSMDPIPLGFDIDPLLLSLMGTGPSPEGSSGIGSPAPSSQEASTPALLHSPDPSRSTTSGPSPMTPNFDPSSVMYAPSSGSMVSQRDRVGFPGSTPPLELQDGAYFCQGGPLYEDLMRRGMFTGMELGMDVDDDFSCVFGMGGASRESSVANQPPQFCDTSRVEFPAFLGPESLSQRFGIAGQATLSTNTNTSSTPLPSVFSQGASDIPSFFAPQQNVLPSPSNTQLPAPATTSFQRQRPVPKRPAPAIPPSKGKAAATLAVAKKHKEDVIEQARDLRRQLLADIGKSKVQLWELTMEQGVLTRMSKDERLKKP